MIHFLAEKEKSNNRDTRNSWETYRSHREKMMELIQANKPVQGGSLCLLGAGNCNDVDLAVLLDFFDSVSLMDLDKEALAHGIAYQKVEKHPKLSLHAGIDLSGILPYMERWTKHAPSNREKSLCLHSVQYSDPLASYHGQFDLVLPCCLLSQMILGIKATRLSQKDQRQLIELLRIQHVRQMHALLRPHGIGIFVTDVISSDTLPELRNNAFTPSLDLLNKLVKERNYFSGLNPFAMLNLLSNHFPSPIQASLTQPWVWHLSEKRSFLNYAIGVKR